jgi:beta-glucosidase
MISHAKAVKLFREKYQPTYGGKIGIVNILQYGEPVTNDPHDIAAALTFIELHYCWFQDTVTFGDYPESVKKLDFGTGILIPKFTAEEKEMLKESIDFVGVNHYTSLYVGNKNFKPVVEEQPSTKPISNPLFPFVASHYDMNKKFIGMQGSSIWLFHYPKGFQKSLEFIKKRYNNPDIYVTENGFSVKEEHHMPLKLQLNDVSRTYYFKTYLAAMRDSIQQSGAKVKGYFAWTLTDNFEWAMGYSTPFGVSVFDKQTGKRYWKDSAFFLKSYFEQAIQK